MGVLHDEGLYRHIRFKQPETIVYYYDLVTWPGHLVITGDAGDFHFSRIRDMFEFFKGESINPQYWAEKIQGEQPATMFDRDEYERRVRAWLEQEIQRIRINCGVEEFDEPDYPAEDRELVLGQIDRRTREVTELVDRKLLDGSVNSDGDAHYRLMEFTGDDGQHIEDAWEWRFRTWHPRFLWCCWAIVRGIARYREAATVSA